MKMRARSRPFQVASLADKYQKIAIIFFYPTRKDHQDVANQLFSCYAKVGDARALASVIGEDELSPIDKKYLAFGKAFESRFIGQGPTENRTILETLDIGWELLGMLPREELDRIDTKILDQYYKPADTGADKE